MSRRSTASEEQQHHTTFSYDIDHPLQFAAQDNGVTPVVYVLVALLQGLKSGTIRHMFIALAEAGLVQIRHGRATAVTGEPEGDTMASGRRG